MSSVFYLINNKNQKTLVVGNFLFKKIKGNAESRCYWRCKMSSCHVRVTTVNNAVINLQGEHMHTNDMQEILKIRLKNLIKEKLILEPYMSSLNLFSHGRQALCEGCNFDPNIVSMLPSFDSVKSSIYRWKSELSPTGIILNVEDLDPNFFILNNGVNFLLHWEFGGDIIIVLGDTEYIRKFSSTREFSLVMDGTFKSSSTSFYQIYIIHGCFNDQSFPLLYCFMNGKTERLYSKVFSIIKTKLLALGINFNPLRIQIDFESAAFNAIRINWPDTRITG